MKCIPVKTRILTPPRDNLFDVFSTDLPALQEGDIVVVTSKVVAIHQGRCIKKKGTNKDKLIETEAEMMLPRNKVPKRRAILTIKNNTLIASAGIDSKNGNGYYILWPKDPMYAAREIWQFLKKQHTLKKLGIIINDTHSVPMRYGTIGIGIGFWGIDPLIDHTRNKGIFGAKPRMTKTNVVDSIAAAATMIMGETSEQTPVVIVRDTKNIRFTTRDQTKNFFTKKSDDMYKVLFKAFDKPKK